MQSRSYTETRLRPLSEKSCEKVHSQMTCRAGMKRAATKAALFIPRGEKKREAQSLIHLLFDLARGGVQRPCLPALYASEDHQGFTSLASPGVVFSGVCASSSLLL